MRLDLPVCKCRSFYGRFLGERKHFWSGRKGSLRRGSIGRMGAFGDTRLELVLNGSVNTNEFGTLALLFSDIPEDDGLVISRRELQLKLPSEIDESNELYDKLAENAMAGESVTDGAEKKNNLEEESDPGQTHVEVGKGQVETRIGVPAYQQASELLASVNKTLDGLEDDLIKHAEELEASTLSEDFVFSGFLELEQIRKEVRVRDYFLDMLRQEAVDASQILSSATLAMVTAKGKITYLQEQLDVATGLLRQEKGATQRALDLLAISLLTLSGAEARVRELEKQVEIGSQAQDYSAENLLDTKEKITQPLRTENHHNASMLVAAAKARESLTNAEKKVEFFTAQVAILKEEVRSRDMLLREVRDEMVCSTDALKLASQIKQVLNATKQKELELVQDLEIERSHVKDLQQELAENRRAVLVEQALQQMEKNLKGLELKVEMLRGGVRARDNALRLMRDEVDRSFEVLSNAAENREAVRQMTSYAEELRAELASKDEKIMSLQEKLSHVEPSLRQERPVMKSNSSVKASTVSGQLRSKNAPNVSTKVKGKSIWRRQGNKPPSRPSPQS
nr:coiled-coil domain-containing protein 39-like isoform X2 [Physcomitrium patens]|eukprot:XP_024389458.1 coiled-coil domain-containing protein 39-like isoform X2 [Physcomitrella patens]